MHSAYYFTSLLCYYECKEEDISKKRKERVGNTLSLSSQSQQGTNSSKNESDHTELVNL